MNSTNSNPSPSRPSLSQRLRRISASIATEAWRNYVNGNRKDARELLRRHKGDTVAIATARFLRMAKDAGQFDDAARFVDSFADF